MDHNRARLILKLARRGEHDTENYLLEKNRNEIWESTVENESLNSACTSNAVFAGGRTEVNLDNTQNKNFNSSEKENLNSPSKAQVIDDESFAFDSDDTDNDPNYEANRSESSSSDDESTSIRGPKEVSTQVVVKEKEGKKRTKNMKDWVAIKSKKLRNTGQPYKSYRTKKEVKGRDIRQPCSEKCRSKCWDNFTEDERKTIFKNYWSMGDLHRQRDFIAGCIMKIDPKYRYVKDGSFRKPNNAFYFEKDRKRIRVCKTFFLNTLDISHRTVRTVLEKQFDLPTNMLLEDLRGKHKNHAHVDDLIKDKIRQHINSVPKIPSHYCRADTKREYIDGSKTLAQIYRDYVKICETRNEPYANYAMFYKIFTQEFNLSFFTPKKDQCEQCVAYQNMSDIEKDNQKMAYEQHLLEKDLARQEKKKDKEETGSDTFVFCYDLQAVFQCPKGDISVFYYKCKLNVLNLTFFDLKSTDVSCFVWHEGEAERGVNEIGTCVLKIIEQKSQLTTEKINLIFYTDNCGGQQKNKFMIRLYQYAIKKFPNINSITHKFLIRGHTQNEGDSAHSLIEREVKRSLKAGPIYTPQHFVSIIRSAKKTGRPFNVIEMTHEDFFNIKNLSLAQDSGCLKNKCKEIVKITEIKVLKITQDQPSSFFYKTSFAEQDFKEVEGQGKKLGLRATGTAGLALQPAYHSKRTLAGKKKEDLMDLIRHNHIPKFYSAFYSAL